MTGQIFLEKGWFGDKERTLCEIGRLKASAFLYKSGVHAVRIENPHGQIVVLPYQGQQVWDVVFHGRRLTMTSYFSEPRPSSSLFDSYGAFMYHCGALRMGTPGPTDTHPVHGELPAAPYSEAHLTLGEDAAGPWLGVSGTFEYTRAFGDKYVALPEVRLREEGTVLDIDMTIRNCAHSPMDLMYMCHVNFLPAENGEIVQATGWDTKDMVVRSVIPSHVTPTPQFLAFLDSLRKDPGVTRVLRPQDVYNPEVVFYLKNLRSDARGMTHMLQKHPDGSSDYISYDVKKLNHTVRWILQHEDQKVMGMSLPSTCDPEGYTAEKKKGNVRTLPGLETASFSVRAGYLDTAGTRQMESMIRSQ
jgi:Domain of unknown function (DUF4432)